MNFDLRQVHNSSRIIWEARVLCIMYIVVLDYALYSCHLNDNLILLSLVNV